MILRARKQLLGFVLVLLVHVFCEVFEGEVAEDVVALEADDE